MQHYREPIFNNFPLWKLRIMSHNVSDMLSVLFQISWFGLSSTATQLALIITQRDAVPHLLPPNGAIIVAVVWKNYFSSKMENSVNVLNKFMSLQVGEVSKDLSRKEKLSVFWFILTYAHEVVTERIRLWIQGESPGCLSSPVETEWGALFVQEGPKGLQLLCIKKATWDVYDAFWTTHRWSVSSVSILEETLKQTQVTQERVFLSTRLVTPQYPPKTARGGSWGEGDLSSTV